MITKESTVSNNVVHMQVDIPRVFTARLHTRLVKAAEGSAGKSLVI